jgi:hypothetical protein
VKPPNHNAGRSLAGTTPIISVIPKTCQTPSVYGHNIQPTIISVSLGYLRLPQSQSQDRIESSNTDYTVTGHCTCTIRACWLIRPRRGIAPCSGMLALYVGRLLHG